MISGIVDFASSTVVPSGDVNDIIVLSPSEYEGSTAHIDGKDGNVKLWAEWDSGSTTWVIHCSDSSWTGYVMYTIVEVD